MKFIAQFNKCDQIGPEDWEVHIESKMFDESATLEDVFNWRLKGVHGKIKDTFLMNDVKIFMPE